VVFEFDRSPSREHTGAVKFDARQAVFGREDVLPLWVADMDFAAPEAVTRALEERARHPVYGYSLFPDSLYDALMTWFAHRHNWRIERDWILMAPGVVPSLHASCLAFAEPGEGVIIQPPVYPPFFSSVQQTGRRVIENPLVLHEGRYQMDLAHLEQCAARDDARVLMLCSPHNPVGRVWTAAELRQVLDIARRHGLVVVSDEIHCDLVYADKPGHTMLAAIAKPEDALVTAVAPSKTFNMPGLGLSALVVPDPARRQSLKAVFDSMHMTQCNPFSTAGFEAGYRHGEAWLDELLPYLQESRDVVIRFLHQRIPEIVAIETEGTYLLWLDCRALGLEDRALKRFFVDEAGLGLNPGISFGEAGSGFMRLNLGSPQSVLMEALARLERAVTSRFR